MLINNSEYLDIISNIKEKIKNAQYRAVISANKEMILLYWNIGNIIVANSNWGNKFIENLARDIKSEFPDAAGYSVRNLKYMKKLALTYQDYEFVQQVGQPHEKKRI